MRSPPPPPWGVHRPYLDHPLLELLDISLVVYRLYLELSAGILGGRLLYRRQLRLVPHEELLDLICGNG